MAVVGARRASAYGLEVARALGRGLSAAGVPVVSGPRARDRLGGARRRARGARDARSASSRPARTSPTRRAAGGCTRRSPRAARWSPRCRPARSAHRWCFVARNRIIAALSAVTVVVQATERSGSLTTADFAAELGRAVGAVPGLVTSRLSAGTHALIQAGAPLVRDAERRRSSCSPPRPARVVRAAPAPPPPALDAAARRACSSAVEDGRGTLGELAEHAEAARAALAGLGELERLGLVRRGFAGRWERAA